MPLKLVKKTNYGFQMILGGIQVNKFTQIHLIFEAKFDDSLQDELYCILLESSFRSALTHIKYEKKNVTY